MDWKLELIPVPVSDVDRAKQFYSEQVGFAVDVDHEANEHFRIVQLTPPGSGCSIAVGVGIGTDDSTAGSMRGLQLCVADVDAARTELAQRGVDVTPVRHMENGTWLDGKGEDWNAFCFFSDPDGNTWVVQESPTLRKLSGAK